MTPHEYPYTFTEAMMIVSPTIKIISEWVENKPFEDVDILLYTYHLDDDFKLKNEYDRTPKAIFDNEIDSMWRRTIE